MAQLDKLQEQQQVDAQTQQQAGDDSSHGGGVQRVLLRLDHMRDRQGYTATIKQWAGELELTGRRSSDTTCTSCSGPTSDVPADAGAPPAAVARLVALLAVAHSHLPRRQWCQCGCLPHTRTHRVCGRGLSGPQGALCWRQRACGTLSFARAFVRAKPAGGVV
jgi:hypothetical protein